VAVVNRAPPRARSPANNGRIGVRYQPVVKLYDERIVGFERSSTGNIPEGTVPPDSFLPVAIETGFIEDVERLGARAGVWPIGAMAATMPDVPRLRMSVIFERSVAPIPDHGLVGRAITDQASTPGTSSSRSTN